MTDDLTRLRTEYERRKHRLAGSNIYSLLNLSHLFIIQQRQRALRDLLRKHDIDFSGKRLLEVGCGGGDVLAEYMAFGLAADQVCAADLIEDRLFVSHTRFPALNLVCADGQALPYPDNSFDFVLQYTVFSSILSDDVKAKIAREMMRVTRKPQGVIIWYDFWLNPKNAQTRGVRRDEISHLFPACDISLRRITLAPPLTRRLVGISWLLCAMLERLRILNTHHLGIIRP